MSIFQFKQFSVDQSQSAMKINTDGVLLGALAETEHAETILDIGTGTGVIALMLAQRFPAAKVYAVELDVKSAETAGRNFKNSPFSDRMDIYPCSFKTFFVAHPDKKYDLIVSNPPFFINSLKPGSKGKEIARHTDELFFTELTQYISGHLTDHGIFWIILPLKTAELFKNMMQITDLKLANTTTVHSFINSEPHRELLAFNRYGSSENFEKFVIYNNEKEHSSQYRKALKNFFIIFE